MTSLTITPAAGNESIVAQTLSSLPVSFAPASPGHDPDIVDVRGDTDWPASALEAIQDGARGVIVTNPTIASSSRIRAIAEAAQAAGIPVVLAEPFASNPGLPLPGTPVAHAMASISAVFVDVVLTAGNREDFLLEGLRTLRALGLTQARIDTITHGRTNVVVDGSITTESGDQAVLAINGTTSSAATSRLSVRAYAYPHTVELDLPAPTTARPAHVALISESGAHVSPTVYENAYRAAWRRLHDAISGRTQTNAALIGFAEDVDTVTTAV